MGLTLLLLGFGHSFLGDGEAKSASSFGFRVEAFSLDSATMSLNCFLDISTEPKTMYRAQQRCFPDLSSSTIPLITLLPTLE